MKRRFLILLCSVVALSGLAPALSAQVKVLESSGSDVSGEEATTILVLELDEREKGETVPIYQVLARSIVYAAGSGGSVGGSGETTSWICDAPATLELPGLQFSDVTLQPSASPSSFSTRVASP